MNAFESLPISSRLLRRRRWQAKSPSASCAAAADNSTSGLVMICVITQPRLNISRIISVRTVMMPVESPIVLVMWARIVSAVCSTRSSLSRMILSICSCKSLRPTNSPSTACKISWNATAVALYFSKSVRNCATGSAISASEVGKASNFSLKSRSSAKRCGCCSCTGGGIGVSWIWACPACSL